jgi:hypothetical protein
MNKILKKKLVYISAPGHSSTTLLDLFCGRYEKVFSMEEAHFLSWQLEQGAREDDLQTWCSCGSTFNDCEVFGPILNRISVVNKIEIFKEPEKYDFSVVRHLERHKSSFFKKVVNKFLSISISHKILHVLSYIPYLIYYKSIKRNWLLFDEVASLTQSEYVVDSSKSFLRYWLLRMYRPNDVKLLIIKRDIKGVVSSSHEGLNESIVKTKTKNFIHYYEKTLKAIKYIDRNDWKLISYESLCENPQLISVEIASFLNVKDVRDLTFRPYTYHTIQGNPMRLKKESLTIKYDERWKDRLTEKQIIKLDEISSNMKWLYD